MDEQEMIKAFGVRKKPPLTEYKLRLLENGFEVEPDYDPFFYEESKGKLDDIIDRLIDEMETKKEKI